MLVICKVLDPATAASPPSLAVIDISGETLVAGENLSFYHLQSGKHPTLNPLLGSGIIKSSTLLTDLKIVKECRAASATMQLPPFNAFLIKSFAKNVPIYRVEFTEPLAAGDRPCHLASVCVRAFAQRSRFADCYKQEVLPLE
jgi:hypothetical protein